MPIANTVIGHGPTKVLIFHGWFGDYTVWNPTLKVIDQNMFQYAFIDYRGYGKSAAMSGNYSMREIAADANKVVRKLGWEKLHVVGHSMGGMAMQRFILDCDKNITVQSAIGVTPVPASGGQLEGDISTLFEGAIRSDDNRYKILDFTTGNRLSATWLKNMVTASRETTNEEAFAGYLRAWDKENYIGETEKIKTPMMVCIGEHDPAMNEDAMKATYLTSYPDCTLQIISNAGHYPMQETPVYLMTLMETFMQRHTN